MTIETPTLNSGEELIWSGQPNPMWFAFRRGWQPLSIGALLLSAFVTYLASPELHGLAPQVHQSPDHVRIVAQGLWTFALPFGVLATGCLLAGVWLGFRAYRTRYLLTDRRVLIDTAGPLPRRFSAPLEHLHFVELRTKLAGPADVIFHETRRASLDGWGLRGEGFIAIPDAGQVETLIRAAIEKVFAAHSQGPWR